MKPDGLLFSLFPISSRRPSRYHFLSRYGGIHRYLYSFVPSERASKKFLPCPDLLDAAYKPIHL